MKKGKPYDKKYSGKEYYWGKKPSPMCDRVIEIMRPNADRHLKLIDLGCGEGRNAVYFARNGFEVVGLDASLPGLEKTRKYAEETGVLVDTIQADITEYNLTGNFDVIFSTGTLQYIPPEIRAIHFEDYKNHTTPGGINAMNVFVKKPFIPKAPDSDGLPHYYKSGKLLGYYWDWEILYCTEEIFDCMSSGIPHKHAIDRVIAKKVA